MDGLHRIKVLNYLSAWRRGDLVRLPDGEQFRLTSDAYYHDKKEQVICNTDRGFPISYLRLIEHAYLVEPAKEIKNEKSE